MTTTVRSTPDIHRVGVVGCGQMGAGIAEICAKAGLDVTVVVSRPESVVPGRRRIEASLDRAVAKGTLTVEQRDAALAGIQAKEFAKLTAFCAALKRTPARQAVR